MRVRLRVRVEEGRTAGVEGLAHEHQRLGAMHGLAVLVRARARARVGIRVRIRVRVGDRSEG